MIRSMTGFGQATAELEHITVWAETSSLNHRHLDVGVRLPAPLNTFENEVRKFVQARIERGRVNVSLNFEGSLPETNQVEFNEVLARQYLDATRAFAQKAGLEDDLSAVSVLRLGPLWSVRPPRPEEITELWELVEKALSAALEQLLEMRRNEGINLWNDLSERIQQIETIAIDIAGHSGIVVDEYRERLKQRISMVVPPGTELDEQRLLTEIAIFADKADISEELTRLDSHIQQFKGIAEQDSNIGRRLDFLLQEMFREISTIGSKARDSRISHAVVEIKGVLEKMREQVQNVE